MKLGLFRSIWPNKTHSELQGSCVNMVSERLKRLSRWLFVSRPDSTSSEHLLRDLNMSEQRRSPSNPRQLDRICSQTGICPSGVLGVDLPGGVADCSLAAATRFRVVLRVSPQLPYLLLNATGADPKTRMYPVFFGESIKVKPNPEREIK